jgi:uncharacterized protein
MVFEERNYLDAFKEEMIILQPGTFCNLTCEYCYLKTTNLNLRMSPEISTKVANYIRSKDGKYHISFHGGEPLAIGRNHLAELSNPFKTPDLIDRVILSVQSNGTLINEDWCDFFKDYEFGVGISIDGSREMTKRRKTKNGQEAYDLILKGINYLNQKDIPFGVLAVVDEANLDHAKELYTSIKNLGAKSFGVNLEEIEGKNFGGVMPGKNVKKFWKELYLSWKEDTTVCIENFHSLFEMLNYVSYGIEQGFDFNRIAINTLPKITAKGDVSLLSPELNDNVKGSQYTFTVGNVFEKPLGDIIEAGKNALYVKDFRKGIEKCINECESYVVCRGGFASNKFFEKGTTNCTRTNNCQTSQIDKLNAVLESI